MTIMSKKVEYDQETQSKLLRDQFTHYTNVNKGRHELELILHIDKKENDQIEMGKFKDDITFVKDSEKYFAEITYQLTKNTRQVVRTITDSKGKKSVLYYTKQSMYSVQYNTLRSNLSIETPSKTTPIMKKGTKFTVKKSKRTKFINNSGTEFTLIAATIDGEEKYRIEIEAEEDQTKTAKRWEDIAWELINLYKIFDGTSSNEAKIVDYYSQKLGYNIREISNLNVKPITYNSKINHISKPEMFLGTVKLDGVTASISIIRGTSGMLDVVGTKSMFNIDAKKAGDDLIYQDIICFGEFMADGSFNLFDTLYLDDNLMEIQNKERLDMGKDVAKYLDNLMKYAKIQEDPEKYLENIKIKHKEFYPMEVKENFSIVIQEDNPNSDGGILYHINGNYKNTEIYKLKWENTVDLLMHVHNDRSTVALCVMTKPQMESWERYDNSKIPKNVKKLGNKYIFDVEQDPELQKINKNMRNNTNMIPVHLEIGGYGKIGATSLDDIVFDNQQIKDIIMNGGSCDFIVECLWLKDEQKWKIFRARPDKIYPNTRSVVISNFNATINPITKITFYAPSYMFFSRDKDPQFDNVTYYLSNTTRAHTVRFLGYTDGFEGNYQDSKGNIDVMVDFASGVGGRLLDISMIGVKKSLWMYDIVEEQLIELGERLSKFPSLSKITSTHAMDLTDEKHVDEEIKRLKSLPVWEKADAVSMIYAIHYMFSSEEALRAFFKMLNFVSKKGTLLVTNIIDIKMAMEVVKTTKKYSIIPPASYNLGIPVNNIFKVSLPYQTVDGTGYEYSEEPVLTTETLIEQMDLNGWDLIEKGPASDDENTVLGTKLNLKDEEDLKWVTAHINFVFSYRGSTNNQ